MKTAISAQHLSYFRREGHVRFDNFPIDFQKLQDLAQKQETTRDIWRKEPFLKKMILQDLGPIALELTKKTALRLACDHWLESPPNLERMKDMFCFQNLSCVFVLTPNGEKCFLDVFEPSSLASKLMAPSYLVVFALENSVIVDNPKDPFTIKTRNLGYVYGDRLTNSLNPIVVKK